MGGVFLAVKIDRAGMQQRPQDLQVLPQVGQRGAQVETEHGAHGWPVAGADAQPETTGSQLVDHLNLLGGNYRVPRVSGRD